MKSDIACLIGEIGNGYGYYQVHGRLFEYVERTTHQRSLWNRLFRIKPKIRTYSREVAIEETITNRVLAAVQKQFDVLLPYFDDTNSYTRAAVAGAMSRYTEQRDTFLPLLNARLMIETDEEAQTAITDAIKALTSTNI